MKYRKLFLLLLIEIGLLQITYAQDPVQPGLNFGLTGMLDGAPPTTGWYYFNYLEYYTANELRNAQGSTAADIELDAWVWLHQLAYLSEAELFGAKLGLSMLFPLVHLNGSGRIGIDANGQPIAFTENPRLIGDLVIAPALQWFDKKIFGKRYAHRFEPTFVVPIGSHHPRYVLNPSSNYFTFQPLYAFTLFLSDQLALSQRHNYLYHFEDPDNNLQTGQAYYGIYSLEYNLAYGFWVAAQGYHLSQFTRDRQYGKPLPASTRESVSAAGISVNWFSASGWAIGIKSLVEFRAKGRSQGVRSRLRVVKQIGKQP